MRELPEHDGTFSDRGLNRLRQFIASKELFAIGQSQASDLIRQIANNPLLGNALMSNSNVVIEPCKLPPALSAIREWMAGRQKYKAASRQLFKTDDDHQTVQVAPKIDEAVNLLLSLDIISNSTFSPRGIEMDKTMKEDDDISYLKVRLLSDDSPASPAVTAASKHDGDMPGNSSHLDANGKMTTSNHRPTLRPTKLNLRRNMSTPVHKVDTLRLDDVSFICTPIAKDAPKVKARDSRRCLAVPRVLNTQLKVTLILIIYCIIGRTIAKIE